MKKKILSLLLLVTLFVCPVLSACGEVKVEEAEGKLTFYCVGEYGDVLSDFIKKYNKYCAVNDCFDDSIEVINFDDYGVLNDTLSTELMAGKGPDILSLNQKIPFEKLVRNSSLADVDKILSDADVNINFDDYNKVVMDSGVVGGKRVIVPLYYSVDILFSTKERLGKFGINIDCQNIADIADKVNEEGINTFLICPYSADSFFCSFIREYIDLEKGTTDFNTEEFRLLAESFKKALLNSQSCADLTAYSLTQEEKHSDYIFSCNEFDYYGGSFTDIAEIYHNVNSQGLTTAICPDFSRNNEVTANVEVGFAINANSKKTEKAAKFIEFLLSESSQGYFSGAREDVVDEMGVSLPVKNSVFEAAFKEAQKYTPNYSDESLSESDVNSAKNKCNRFLEEEYLPLVKNISKCDWYGKITQLSSNLYQNIAREIVGDYLDSKITLDSFVDKLTASFNLYLNE